jgi:hypothetical protein
MSELGERTSIVRALEDGERRWFYGGGLHIWKAKSEETGGAFLLFEDRLDHGKVTPLHIHPDSEETMIVLEGEIVMHLDGVDHTVAGRRHRQRTASCAARLPGLGRGWRSAALLAHSRLLPVLLLGRKRTGNRGKRQLIRTARHGPSPRLRAEERRYRDPGSASVRPGLARCFVSDLDLAGTGGEQLGRTEPAGLKPVACSSCAGRPGMVACLRSSADQPSSNSAIQPDAQVPFS